MTYCNVFSARAAGTRLHRSAALAALTLASGVAQAAGFTNGDFLSTAGWVLSPGAAYDNTSSFAGSGLPAGQAVMVLTANNPGPSASITQTFDHAVAYTRIAFDLAAPSVDAALALQVTLNGMSQTTSGIYPIAPGATNFTFGPSGWHHFELLNVNSIQPFTGSPLGVTQDELKIFTINPAFPTNNQLLIRNVVVEPLLLPAVPEPGTYAMMLAGMGLLGFAARRKAAKA